MKAFKVEFHLDDKEYMTALRLAVGAVCALTDLNVDDIEDVKVCITESCLMLKDGGYASVSVSLIADGKFKAEVAGIGGAPHASDDGFSSALISALVTDCKIQKTDGIINKISFEL